MSMRLTPHRFISANPVGVDWVCGDLHGEFDALQTALSEAGFNKAADRLFLLGDTIDRGPESRALLEWVLDTNWVYSVMGNHELMFIAGAEDNRNRYKHRGMGGDWATSLDETTYKNLATQCRYQLPLTMTLECENGQLGLVHAQSPFDDWRTVQESSFSERFAIECTWPWTGPREKIKPLRVSRPFSGTQSQRPPVSRMKLAVRRQALSMAATAVPQLPCLPRPLAWRSL